jgi:hypothetical protein
MATDGDERRLQREIVEAFKRRGLAIQAAAVSAIQRQLRRCDGLHKKPTTIFCPRDSHPVPLLPPSPPRSELAPEASLRTIVAHVMEYLQRQAETTSGGASRGMARRDTSNMENSPTLPFAAAATRAQTGSSRPTAP